MQTTPSSPFKKSLQVKVAKLEPLEKIHREVVAAGQQSLVLTEGHHHVLLATRYLVAKNNVQYLQKLDPATCPFALPSLVAFNVDLAALIDPLKPNKTRGYIKRHYTIYPELWCNNVIYKMPRYPGTLMDLKKIRFNEISIEHLNKTIQASLKFLHDNDLTHNDISAKNIFYSGQHPTLQFHLGDFGSITLNSKTTHELKRQKDMQRLKRVVEEAHRILKAKMAHSQKISQSLLFLFEKAEQKDLNEVKSERRPKRQI